ncbi:MAG: peptide-methionine (R)-S-oxide reductase MsrB [Christensenellaceae bacterium]|jgi:peptide methionine sulfoxide reductase msrA/msrB
MKKEIYLAGGCFWGVEKYFALIEGVLDTEVGYANGNTEHPTYEQVCRENTGHAETVRIVYDGDMLSLSFLLTMYYQVIDPTSLNKQGNDIGAQYRTGIYYTDAADLPIIEASLTELQKKYRKPLAIEVAPLRQFFSAEAYHQDYLDKNPGGYCHIPNSAFKKAAKARPEKPYQKHSKKELKEKLSPMSFHVTQENGTEPPFENAYYDETSVGIYVDITTGEPLFTSNDKFDAGCGWPSFAKPIDEALLTRKKDLRHGMLRIEVRSHLGDAHLGHVFSDGPEELGGLRYCINSAALKFIPLSEMQAAGYGKYLKYFEASTETENA